MTALTVEPLLARVLPSTPGLRLVAAPASAPPYDDELVDGAPVLQLVPALTSVPEQAGPGDVPLDHAEAWLAASRTPSDALPPARAVARVLLQGVLEVLAGVRPLRQLQRDTTAELYTRLQSSLESCPGRGAGGAVRPDGRAVRSVHVQERPEGVAEVCATVVRDGRTAALALRLEGLDGRWRCTELAGF